MADACSTDGFWVSASGEGRGVTDLRGEVSKRVDGLLVVRLLGRSLALSWVDMGLRVLSVASKKALRGEPYFYFPSMMLITSVTSEMFTNPSPFTSPLMVDVDEPDSIISLNSHQ